jgi:hypothetical protein
MPKNIKKSTSSGRGLILKKVEKTKTNIPPIEPIARVIRPKVSCKSVLKEVGAMATSDEVPILTRTGRRI